ncbi:Alb1 domain containing protein [Pyrenophora tritici-repentis]|uniref:Alb1 n=1 Tax=Pyrenophora tritici-repentis TaxID=45151 RepID=A0A2W1CW10_9PLEO|nr:Alb1 multi-domain protein [Pyrenophora tritici-repentis]KAF7449451.1 Alb1 multi-domain protein [Pyrenophora tritici-repentis]KAF7570443.1 Alb1 multi-domain protein [Pyrenophora tritici-repentis]KAG9383695.1 Alb1 multi-domain protein [Pyrenophora tritici-repentis]KAI0574040.1 Alb1 multi-domain protein [Pyrenophora tritici-repentis]
MAKTAKVKKRQVTVHSRAARRAASPSLNLDKSAQKPAHTTRDSASPSRPSKVNPHALAAKDAGIQKKQRKSGNMTRAQRLRYQKGLERAEDNMEKLEKKRMKSLGKEKKIKERAKGWEDVNGEGLKKSKKGHAVEEVEVEEMTGDGGWVSDEEMDEVLGDAGATDGEVKVEGKKVDTAVPETVSAPAVEVEEML